VEDQPATASTTQPVPHPNTTTQLPCPDDPSQALAWLTSEQLVLSALYDSLPPPDATKLQELAADIAHHGMLQPVLATPAADGAHYEVLIGRRRVLAAGNRLRLLPALVQQLSSKQKRLAFLSANLCIEPLPNQQEFARQYDAAWVTNEEGTAENNAVALAPELDTALEQASQLAPFLQRHLVRQLLFNDAGLYQSVLEEARRQVAETDGTERKRLTGELRELQTALTEERDKGVRQERAIENLARQLNQERVSRGVVDDTREELEQARQELATSNKKLQQQVQTLLARVATLEPLERVAGIAEAGAVLTAVMAVVEAAGPNLVRTALHLLDPRAGHGAAAALQRALEQLATRVRECQTAMARGATAMATRTRAEPVTPSEAPTPSLAVDAGEEGRKV